MSRTENIGACECCAEPFECSFMDCTTGTASECYEFALAGITSGSCASGCPDLNGTHVLTFSGSSGTGLGECFFDETTTFALCDGSPCLGLRFQLSVSTDATNRYWQLTARLHTGGCGTGTDQIIWYLTETRATTCSGSKTLPFFSGTVCTNIPANVTIDPIACP